LQDEGALVVPPAFTAPGSGLVPAVTAPPSLLQPTGSCEGCLPFPNELVALLKRTPGWNSLRRLPGSHCRWLSEKRAGY